MENEKISLYKFWQFRDFLYSSFAKIKYCHAIIEGRTCAFPSDLHCMMSIDEAVNEIINWNEKLIEILTNRMITLEDEYDQISRNLSIIDNNKSLLPEHYISFQKQNANMAIETTQARANECITMFNYFYIDSNSTYSFLKDKNIPDKFIDHLYQSGHLIVRIALYQEKIDLTKLYYSTQTKS